MRRRIITVVATYDMSGIPVNETTPKERVEKNVIEEMEEFFGEDEGYDGVEVTVVDTIDNEIIEFERIKAMDVTDLAIYINKLQVQAVRDYENGFFPKGIIENMTMLNGEVKKE